MFWKLHRIPYTQFHTPAFHSILAGEKTSSLLLYILYTKSSALYLNWNKKWKEEGPDPTSIEPNLMAHFHCLSACYVDSAPSHLRYNKERLLSVSDD